MYIVYQGLRWFSFFNNELLMKIFFSFERERFIVFSSMRINSIKEVPCGFGAVFELLMYSSTLFDSAISFGKAK